MTQFMRGQTTLDFAIGVSIFILALISVLLFIPGTIGPFTEGGQEDIGAANRVAASLSGGTLGDPANPYTLNRTCTVDYFFENSTTNACRFEGSNPNEFVGADTTQNINVTLQANLSNDGDGKDILCWDRDAPALVEIDNSDCDTGAGDTELAIGNRPPASSDTTVTARRVVQMNGTQMTLLIEMW